MTFSQLSWLLLILQLVMLAATAFVVPLILRPRWTGYFLYTIGAGILWLAYTVAAMLFDSKAGKDVPGIGYLLIGFVGWGIGSAIYLFRMNRQK